MKSEPEAVASGLQHYLLAYELRAGYKTRPVWNDTDTPLAYLITFRSYGTWLHGDERGSTIASTIATNLLTLIQTRRGSGIMPRSCRASQFSWTLHSGDQLKLPFVKPVHFVTGTCTQSTHEQTTST